MTSVSSIEVGSIAEGTISGITNFGAFVLLATGQTGLVHISEVADAYVRDVRDFLKEGDKVRVKVVSIDERGKMALSIKQADPSYRPAPAFRLRERRGGSQSFEDKLARFLKDSEDKQADLRRVEGKRGGRGGGRQGFGD